MTPAQAKTHTRSFGGINPPTSINSSFEKKHLKAYLKGHSRFSFGRDNFGHERIFKVAEILTPIKK